MLIAMLDCKPSPAYLRRVSLLLGSYVVVFAGVFAAFTAKVVPAPLMIPVALLPMVPAAFLPFYMLNQLRLMDELQRKIRFEAMSFAFTTGALAAASYGFLQMFAGAPDVSWLWVALLFVLLFVVGVFVGRWRYR